MFTTLLLLMLAGSPERVALTVTPQVTSTPATIRTKITIQPDYLAREVCVSWNSEDGEAGSHCWPHNGEYEHKTAFYNILLHTPGTYVIQATLLRVRDTISSTPQTVLVN